MRGRTYVGFAQRPQVSWQREYTEEVDLLDAQGRVQASGWARHNVFRYDRDRVQHPYRRKEWDFYQISNGQYMLQVSFANISLGGYAQAVLVDLRQGRTLDSVMTPFLGGADRYVLPAVGDRPGHVRMQLGHTIFETDTTQTSRTIRFRGGDITVHLQMDILPWQENITTVLPFDGAEDRYFMTTKQNGMPCAGYVHTGKRGIAFSKADTFAVLDWGRVCTPYRLVWFWGNGACYLPGPDGRAHIFAFEITWGIGNEQRATETCLFYDGVAHKIGAVDVVDFPKPDKYMQPWVFTSQDGRFEMTMQPFYDHHADTNLAVMRMNSHQVHGIWNGTATLDDGTVLAIHDMVAFCEYVENRW